MLFVVCSMFYVFTVVIDAETSLYPRQISPWGDEMKRPWPCSGAACGSGGRAGRLVTWRLLVCSSAPPSGVSRCPWARCLTLTALDELAVSLHGWFSGELPNLWFYCGGLTESCCFYCAGIRLSCVVSLGLVSQEKPQTDFTLQRPLSGFAQLHPQLPPRVHLIVSWAEAYPGSLVLVSSPTGNT